MFMRFTIQANAASRELRSFVLDILSTLVGQAVWSDTQQWRGWVVCVRELLPDSLPVLLQVCACLCSSVTLRAQAPGLRAAA